VSTTARDTSADAAAIHQWVDHWYGEQNPDKDGYVMRMTVDYLRITGTRAIVAGDYGHALPGASKLNSLSGHYVRLLEKKDGKWVNTDKIGFVYSDFQRPGSAIKRGEP
jgi:hypothetical protein